MDIRRNLLWIDGSAGLAVGAVMLLTSGWLSQWYGLPFQVVLFISVANLAYGSYSFSLARRSVRPAKLITFLVVANLTWPVVCLVLIIACRETATFLGFGHLILEGLFVGGLGCLEWHWRQFLQSDR